MCTSPERRTGLARPRRPWAGNVLVYYRWRLLPGWDVRAHLRADLLTRVDITSRSTRKRRALERFQTQTTRYFPWQVRPILTPALGLIYGSPILKPVLFEIPHFGTLSIHHGKLPEYRGEKTMVWAMANSEGEAGVTIQRINAGLDTGDIASEGAITIGGRSVRKVWRDVEALGLDLYLQAVLHVRSGAARARPNPGPKGTLFRDPKMNELLAFYRRRYSRRPQRPKR